MVDKNDLRAGFSARLHEALNDAGVRTRGRGVDVHLSLRARGVKKTTQAVSKWLNGESLPEPDTMLALSAWLNVRREWLEYGVSPKTGAQSAETFYGADHQIKETQSGFREVPLITWADAADYAAQENVRSHVPRDASFACPIPISANGFALTVRGDSMSNPHAGKSYPPGTIIFVEPSAEANPSDAVIVQLPGVIEATFKILAIDSGQFFLKPLNPQYPAATLPQDAKILGKVIGSFHVE